MKTFEKQLHTTLSLLLLIAGCASHRGQHSDHTPAKQNREIVPIEKVKWEPLNPARGEKSPLAATLWGDRQENKATGFIAKFPQGFSSPPHIHNTSYRAVVIQGNIHNDDPDARHAWMPPGSFWTQPRGETHITAAKDSLNLALVEIDHGPYLVQSAGQNYDSGERPINKMPSHLVWMPVPGFSSSEENPQLAHLWGSLKKDKARGIFVQLPTGFEGVLTTKAMIFRTVVIQGQLKLINHDLNPGSYFGSHGKASYHIATPEENTLLYIHTNNNFHIERFL